MTSYFTPELLEIVGGVGIGTGVGAGILVLGTFLSFYTFLGGGSTLFWFVIFGTALGWYAVGLIYVLDDTLFTLGWTGYWVVFFTFILLNIPFF